MKVLSVNKFYYLKGGSEACYFALNKMYQDHKIESIPFSMKSEKNEKTEYEQYFVENINYNDASFIKKLKNSAKIIYSHEARRNLRRLLQDTKPDIAHLHVFQHQLSPSIIWEVKKAGLPVVNTVHDLKPICPNYIMLSHESVCEKCYKHRYINCLLNRCVKNSSSASLVASVEMYVHHMAGSYNMIDTYITPSLFFRDKLVEYGFSPEKVRHIPNFIDCSKYRYDLQPSDYFIYFGRLSFEKGIRTLLQAMKSIKKSSLLILGDGPMMAEAEEIIQLEKLDNVSLLGHVSGSMLKKLIENSRFSILPSEWYENCPMSVLESMACGKPVIGASIGGIPELVEHERNGLLFEPGNAEQLSLHINRLLDNPEFALQLGKEGRKKAQSEYDPETNFMKIINIYDQLLTNCGRHSWKL